MIVGAIKVEPHWREVAELPAERKDGRDVLLWAGRMVVASWFDGWRDGFGRLVRGVTHYADVGEPS